MILLMKSKMIFSGRFLNGCETNFAAEDATNTALKPGESAATGEKNF